MRKLVGLQLFRSGTPTFSIGTPTFCQMGVLNSCFQNPSESSVPSWLSMKLKDLLKLLSKQNRFAFGVFLLLKEKMYFLDGCTSTLTMHFFS